MTRLALGCVALLLATACDDDGGGETSSGASSTGTPMTSSTGTPDPSGSSSSTSGDPSGESSSSTSGAGSTSTGAAEESSSSGNPNACDPVVPGEFNACIGDDGNIDNTLCNWMGVGGATGFIGCLTSSMTDGANVCMISDCEEACDCFAPPATGNAPVECAEVLEGGGRACVLTCSNGETCPDGMSCEGGLCFHLPPS